MLGVITRSADKSCALSADMRMLLYSVVHQGRLIEGVGSVQLTSLLVQTSLDQLLFYIEKII